MLNIVRLAGPNRVKDVQHFLAAYETLPLIFHPRRIGDVCRTMHFAIWARPLPVLNRSTNNFRVEFGVGEEPDLVLHAQRNQLWLYVHLNVDRANLPALNL